MVYKAEGRTLEAGTSTLQLLHLRKFYLTFLNLPSYVKGIMTSTFQHYLFIFLKVLLCRLHSLVNINPLNTILGAL